MSHTRAMQTRPALPPPRRAALLVALLLPLAAALAYGVRVINKQQVFTEGGVRLLDGDSMYHIRRAAYAAEHAFALPARDAFMNYPQGLVCNWSPLFDWMIAGVALLAGGGHPTPHTVAAVGALAPPVIAALTVLVVFFLARGFVGPVFALLAALALALMPFHVQLSVLGRPDHHVAIVWTGALTLLAATWLSAARTPATALRRGILTALALAAMLATWPGAILAGGTLALAFGLLLALPAPDAHRRALATGGATLFALTALLLAPLAATSPAAAVAPWRWDALSRFQPAFLLCVAGGLGLLYAIGRLLTPNAAGRRRWLPAASLMLASLALIAIAGGGKLSALLHEGALWMSKRDPIFRHVEESAPMTMAALREDFSALAFLFPAALVILLARAWRDRREPALVVAVWSVVAGAAALLQERFADLFTFCAAVLFAVIVAAAANLCRRLAQRHPALGILAALALLAAGWVALLPPARWLRGYAQAAPHASNAAEEALCRWLRDHTPAPANADPATDPGYSVLADWSLGNAIAAVGHRANVANNFIGWPETRRANEAPYRFFVTSDTNEAAAILAEHRVRYVVVSEPLISGHLGRMLDVLGRSHDAFFASVATDAGLTFQPTTNATQSMAFRLYFHDAQGLAGFERVYESDAKQWLAGAPRPAYIVYRCSAP